MMQLLCPCSKKKASPKDSAMSKEMKHFTLYSLSFKKSDQVSYFYK